MMRITGHVFYYIKSIFILLIWIKIICKTFIVRHLVKRVIHISVANPAYTGCIDIPCTCISTEDVCTLDSA